MQQTVARLVHGGSRSPSTATPSPFNTRRLGGAIGAGRSEWCGLCWEAVTAKRTRRRWAWYGGVIIAALAAYGCAAVLLAGWAWPYPVVLPSTFRFYGNTYHRDSACRSLAQINGHGPPRLHRVGDLPSALWFGDRAIYSYTLRPSFSKTYDYVVVQDGGCYRFYSGDLQV